MSPELNASGENDRMESARQRAFEKAKRIVNRYGDADGLRTTSEYIQMLIEEEMMTERLSCVCEEIKKLYEGVSA